MINKSLAVTVLTFSAMVLSCSTDHAVDSATGGAAGAVAAGTGGGTSSGGEPGATCGNGTVEAGETCDPCPAACDDGDPCTRDALTGSAETCNAVCTNTAITACVGGDSCCPATCNGASDSDCSSSCGNGAIETGETCDPVASCPANCDDGNACTVDRMTGSAANCNVDCSHITIGSCASGDGCCPPGCDAAVDTDCSGSCGNGVVEAGETCDPANTCPESCDDSNACTLDQLIGSSATCDVACNHTPITTCVGTDGCCPAGCGAADDSDCSSSCGDGVVDAGETCDPASSCPASCDDNDACTVDQMTGSAANCNASCSNTAITACTPSDGCCPAGCTAPTDSDCSSGTGGSGGTGGTDSGGTGGTGTGGTIVLSERPCDIYANNGTPCVAAFSMVRVLSRDYTGPLYQVRRGAPNPYKNTGSGGETQDIGFDENGFADAAAQDAFCAGTTCTVSILYDQSPMGNDLRRGNAGCYTGGDGSAAQDDYESDATAKSLTVGGHDVYALYTNVHEGYRNNNAAGTAVGTEAQGVYMVADGTHHGSPCCFDFGNASKDTCFGPTGIMNALMFGEGFWGMGSGAGPWMMADFELGVWAGGHHGIWPGMADYINDFVPPGQPPITLAGTEVPEDEIQWEQNLSMNYPYVFGALTSEYVQAEGRSHYAIRSGNATAGNTLSTAYDDWTEIAFVQEGAIILGVGGDNSNWSWGTFFEGAMTAGRPTAATDQAVYANVQAAGYGQ
jgi:hypothetical protein